MDTVDINVVKSQADILGITYHHRANANTIAGMVAAHLAAHPQDALRLVPSATEEDVRGVQQPAAMEDPSKPDKDEEITTKQVTKADGAPCPVKPLSAKDFARTAEADRVKGINALKRCIIQCMNPAKREWPGETISVGSAKHGTYKKHIPFNSEPYHVPKIIYDVLKERKCTVYRTEKAAHGNERRVGYLINEFNIVDLPPLTRAELEELRTKQQMAKAGL
jgi:hypothetical protein